jgi:hypothetical protein
MDTVLPSWDINFSWFPACSKSSIETSSWFLPF